MIGWLGLVVESAAVAAAAAGLVSILSWLLFARVDRDRVSPARRADLALLCGLLPMLAALASLFALVLPSVLHAGGVQPDHCLLHHHHQHLCALHGAVPHVGLLTAGAAAYTVWMVRAARLAASQWSAFRSIAALQRLGRWTHEEGFARVLVPGSPWLSLAAGVVRPRVLVSASLRAGLSDQAFQAVLAHEEAHLRRRDPQWIMLLGWAGLFAVPALAGRIRAAFQEAAEEASDAEAAEALGVHALASALVAVARIQLSRPPALALGFGYTAVERRVRVLLGQPLRPARSMAARIVLAAVAVTAGLAATGSDWMHHAVESLLQ